jgi:carbon storage regulator
MGTSKETNMLVLSREKDQEVVIGNNVIVVTVVEIRGDKVRLGFTAPREIPIVRRELLDRMDDPEGNE